MWTEKSILPSRKYEKKAPSPKPYTFLSGHHRLTRQVRCLTLESKVLHKGLIHARTVWERDLHPEVLGYSRKKREEIVPKPKKFGISLAGIKVKREEISVDPKKFEPKVFYLFSYKDEKYVARKTDEDVVEIYEVIE